MIEEIKDLVGFNIHVGDNVVWSESSSSYCSYLCYGRVINIEKKKVQTWITVEKIISGDGYTGKYNKIRKFIYPRQHHNLIVI